MLLQSHNDQIRLPPAHPSKWPSGSVKRIRARQQGTLASATIGSDLGRKCRVRTIIPLQVSSSEGSQVATVLEEPGGDFQWSYFYDFFADESVEVGGLTGQVVKQFSGINR